MRTRTLSLYWPDSRTSIFWFFKFFRFLGFQFVRIVLKAAVRRSRHCSQIECSTYRRVLGDAVHWKGWHSSNGLRLGHLLAECYREFRTAQGLTQHRRTGWQASEYLFVCASFLDSVSRTDRLRSNSVIRAAKWSRPLAAILMNKGGGRIKIGI